MSKYYKKVIETIDKYGNDNENIYAISNNTGVVITFETNKMLIKTDSVYINSTKVPNLAPQQLSRIYEKVINKHNKVKASYEKTKQQNDLQLLG